MTAKMNGFALLSAIVAFWQNAGHAGETPPAAERKLRFTATDQKHASAWQKQARNKLFEFLKLSDLVQADLGARDGRPRVEFKVNVKSSAAAKGGKFTRYDLEMNSTPTRRIPVVLTIPAGEGRFPAVVCIHGHGGNRNIVHAGESIYGGFALELANRGCATIATEVGQHNVYEKDRALMGERLWDVMRCVSYLTSRPEVDAGRIGCAGLSLGGEMAMWLGAMDSRVQATVSSGFLTFTRNMLHGHCMCWDFPGLRENFDFPDVYSLIAPRRLMCQNGRKDPIFAWKLAEAAMGEIKQAYRCFDLEERAVLQLHDGEHVFDVGPAVQFLVKALAPSPAK